jgi:hypothetical protein
MYIIPFRSMVGQIGLMRDELTKIGSVGQSAIKDLKDLIDAQKPINCGHVTSFRAAVSDSTGRFI